VVVVDADMMAGLKVAAEMDALTHAIEGDTTLAAWELTAALHLKAIEIIAAWLPGSVAGAQPLESAGLWASTSPGWASPMSAWAWCMRWPTH
jgi:alcohol dehydrogenase class IV